MAAVLQFYGNPNVCCNSINTRCRPVRTMNNREMSSQLAMEGSGFVSAMESGERIYHSGKEDEEIPSLIKATQGVACFDSSKDLKISIPDAVEAAAAKENKGDTDVAVHRKPSVSISMPSSPMEPSTIVIFRDDAGTLLWKGQIPNSAAKCYSQPMLQGASVITNPGTNKLQYLRFDSFKTWSGKLERQISNLRGKQHQIEEDEPQMTAEFENLPVDRFFDALEGPELDTLRASEEIILPGYEKWPFLLRFPISTFGICLGISSQAIMWKALASSDSTKFLHITPNINLALWLISVALLFVVSFIYSLKIIFYFEAVRREYFHPVRVNFFFAPLITLLFLAHGVPSSITPTLHLSLWYVLMAPILCLEVKIYGQWMSGGQRRLSKVANPSNHLALVGNFAGALLGASMGIKEGPVFFFAVGFAHYVVLFVTLYQRLPTNETLPKELHPVFFLFVAAPSTASMAWAKIQGSFDYGSRIAYFIALFLYFSLAVRVNFFRGFRFSLAWWAYTFPMTGAAIATIKYADTVPTAMARGLTAVLCIVATLAAGIMLVTTVVHACVLKDLFPNDMVIAISGKRPQMTRRWRAYHRRPGSSSDTTLNSCTDSDCKDVLEV